MSRIITTIVYKFNELNEGAKDVARAWQHACVNQDEYWAEYITEDAKTIGFQITGWNLNPVTRTGKFMSGYAKDTATKILNERGEECQTYKLAERYTLLRSAIACEHETQNECRDHADQLSDLDDDFCKSLQAEYASMLNKEYEYRTSDECLDENMVANEYEFNEDGSCA